MGYAFTGSWSEISGPTAPLTGGWRNITTTVTGDSDYGDVTRESPGKLILGVPYYGCQWRTSGPEAGAATGDFVKYPQLWETLPGAEKHERQWHASSSTSWYRYQVNGWWHQVWYDDMASLGLKIDLALREDLRGVGVWALGYESRRREPWELLAQKLGRRAPGTAVVEDSRPNRLALAQNSPNPFNGATRVAYEIDDKGRVDMEIFDALGRRVRRWHRQHDWPGTYSLTWDGLDSRRRPAGSGVYLYRLVYTDEYGTTWTRSRRMVLAR
jgi:hypothetical protein